MYRSIQWYGQRQENQIDNIQNGNCVTRLRNRGDWLKMGMLLAQKASMILDESKTKKRT